MAHIVYITNGMSSTLNSSLELSDRLRRAGHEVSYISHAPIGETVDAHGHAFHRVTRDRELAEEFDGLAHPWSGGSPRSPNALLAWWRDVRRIRRASIESDEILLQVQALNPDLLIVDIEMHTSIISTARLGIPTVLAIVWFSIFNRPGLPPMNFTLLPATGWRSRLAIALARWRNHFGMRWSEWRRRLSRQGLKEWLRPIRYATVRIDDLRAFARAHDYPLRRETDRMQWLRPFCYRHVPVLCFNLRELEFPHDPHPNLRYVGPMVHRDRDETRFDETSKVEWERLLEARRASDAAGRPLVYCSLGSFWAADEAFLRRVVHVFERRPEWDLVLGLGGKLDSERLAPTPPNVHLLEWAPQLRVLEIADCAIIHGGITSINECILYHVPMVVYSTSYVDQDGCAARVDYHGLGVRGDRETDTSEQIEANVELVLTTAEYRERVDVMRDHMLAYERSGTAVAAVEALLA